MTELTTYRVPLSRLTASLEVGAKDCVAGDIESSYSGDTICANDRVRKPFGWQGDLWVTVSATVFPDSKRAKAYRLIPAHLFWEATTTYKRKILPDWGESARNDPMGFYHGISVTTGGETYILCGPPAIFVADPSLPSEASAEQLGLF
ncbi:hypothetical protein [Edaphobacter dinghuensis]|uniref:Uncharacterized protein n=1 Tax=Edaphobacter dinghuensis TaxID=1560005 RepID=A0A917HRB9_9BACT|nr:hypothetical protein [Edaphobacter dinghuensis]GGG86593.1 hypothetical protein GCM10011585_33190 [Edaphobacter dinghuensis]